MESNNACPYGLQCDYFSRSSAYIKVIADGLIVFHASHAFARDFKRPYPPEQSVGFFESEPSEHIVCYLAQTDYENVKDN